MGLRQCNDLLFTCLKVLQSDKATVETVSGHLSSALQALSVEDYFSASVLTQQQMAEVALFFQYLHAISGLITKRLLIAPNASTASSRKYAFVPNVAAEVDQLFVRLDQLVPRGSFLKGVLNDLRDKDFIVSVKPCLMAIETSIVSIYYPIEKSERCDIETALNFRVQVIWSFESEVLRLLLECSMLSANDKKEFNIKTAKLVALTELLHRLKTTPQAIDKIIGEITIKHHAFKKGALSTLEMHANIVCEQQNAIVEFVATAAEVNSKNSALPAKPKESFLGRLFTSPSLRRVFVAIENHPSEKLRQEILQQTADVTNPLLQPYTFLFATDEERCRPVCSFVRAKILAAIENLNIANQFSPSLMQEDLFNALADEQQFVLIVTACGNISDYLLNQKYPDQAGANCSALENEHNQILDNLKMWRAYLVTVASAVLSNIRNNVLTLVASINALDKRSLVKTALYEDNSFYRLSEEEKKGIIGETCQNFMQLIEMKEMPASEYLSQDTKDVLATLRNLPVEERQNLATEFLKIQLTMAEIINVVRLTTVQIIPPPSAQLVQSVGSGAKFTGPDLQGPAFLPAASKVHNDL